MTTNTVAERLQAWRTLRGVVSYLRRVMPSRRACTERDEEYGPCWWSGDLNGEECPVCLERHDTVQAMDLVRKRLYVTTRQLERAIRRLDPMPAPPAEPAGASR